jgi:hypothetical protein
MVGWKFWVAPIIFTFGYGAAVLFSWNYDLLMQLIFFAGLGGPAARKRWKAIEMSATVDWEAACATYLVARKRHFFGSPDDGTDEENPDPVFAQSAELLLQVTAPSAEDLRWLCEAMKNDERKWFVGEVAKQADSIAEGLFVPLLEAGIREINPSVNRIFIEPCLKAFGARRVNTYLLDVVEKDDSDFRKAGAVNALYWAQFSLSFPEDAPAFTWEYATAESRAGCEALADVFLRKRLLYLETFVSNTNLHVRRSVIASLRLDDALYPESHKPLVSRAIVIARGHEDAYIRHRVEVQLGNQRMLKPIPHRRRDGEAEEPS